MANSQPSTYFFENVRDYFLNDDITIANCENVFSDNDNLAKTDKGEAAALEQYNNAVAEYNSAVALAQQSGTTVSMEKPEYTFRAFWSAPTLQLPSSCRKMASILSRLTTTTLMISAPMATWIRVLP